MTTAKTSFRRAVAWTVGVILILAGVGWTAAIVANRTVFEASRLNSTRRPIEPVVMVAPKWPRSLCPDPRPSFSIKAAEQAALE
jgi:hypothetical protein